MTLELYMLLATCALYFLIPYVHNVPRVRKSGLEWAWGDRSWNPELPPWVDRVERAHHNFAEWLPVFAVFVVVAHLTGASSTWTEVGAVAYPITRILYTVAYGLGSKWRWHLWYVSSLCLLPFLIEIVAHDLAGRV